MRTLPFTAVLPALVVAILVAAPARAQEIALEPDSRVRLAGTSTLHDWACEATEMNTRLIAPGTIDHLAVRPQPDQGIGELTLPISALECGDDRMERQMRDVLRASEFPEIRYLLTAYRSTPEHGDLTIEASGTITVAGVTRPLVVQVEGSVDDAGILHAAGTASFRMTDFGLQPPSAFFGLLKAGDLVRVRFDLRARVGDAHAASRYLSAAP
jgi:hypothetical protein